MADILLLAVKRGTVGGNHESGGIHNLQPHHYVRMTEAEYSKYLANPSYYGEERRAFFHVAYSVSDEAKLKDLMFDPRAKTVEDSRNPHYEGDKSLPVRNRYLDDKWLKDKCSIELADVLDGTQRPVISGATLDGGWKSIGDSKLGALPYGDVGDRAAWTSGTKTCGTAGDYALLSAAVVDMGTLTGNATINQISSFTDNAQCNYDTKRLGGFTFTINNSSPHGGVFGVGYIITISYTAARYMYGNYATDNGTIDWKNLQLKRGGELAWPMQQIWLGASTGVTLSGNISYFLIDTAAYNNAGGIIVGALGGNNNVNVYNCMIYSSQATGSGFVSYYNTGGNRTHVWSNNTIYGKRDEGCFTCSAGGTIAVTFRDCVVIDTDATPFGGNSPISTAATGLTYTRVGANHGDAQLAYKSLTTAIWQSDTYTDTAFTRVLGTTYRGAATAYTSTDILGNAWDTGYSWLGSKNGVTQPSIITQPSTLTVTEGDNATFTVAASGSASLAYAWMKSAVTIAGGNVQTYTIAAASAGNAGVYSVYVSNDAGNETSSDATLTVNAGLPTPGPAGVQDAGGYGPVVVQQTDIATGDTESNALNVLEYPKISVEVPNIQSYTNAGYSTVTIQSSQDLSTWRNVYSQVGLRMQLLQAPSTFPGSQIFTVGPAENLRYIRFSISTATTGTMPIACTMYREQRGAE